MRRFISRSARRLYCALCFATLPATTASAQIPSLLGGGTTIETAMLASHGQYCRDVFFPQSFPQRVVWPGAYLMVYLPDAIAPDLALETRIGIERLDAVLTRRAETTIGAENGRPIIGTVEHNATLGVTMFHVDLLAALWSPGRLSLAAGTSIGYRVFDPTRFTTTLVDPPGMRLTGEPDNHDNDGGTITRYEGPWSGAQKMSLGAVVAVQLPLNLDHRVVVIPEAHVRYESVHPTSAVVWTEGIVLGAGITCALAQ